MRRTPEWWRRKGAVSLALWPLSWLYRAGDRLNGAFHKPVRAAVPVICVGNAVAGGAGKTPVVDWLAMALAADGRRVRVVSRGYGGSLQGPVAVTAAHRADEVGDEPKMLSARHGVTIGRDRAAAIKAAAADAELIVMDDGLQNPRVVKDVSLLVIDGGYGIGNGFVLPAGPMRTGLGRAIRLSDAAILIGEDRFGMERRLGALPVFRGRLVAEGGAGWAGRRVFAFAGIGRPEKFFETLRMLGVQLAGHESFPDHHPYRDDELLRMSLAAEALGATLATTEKDAVRLPQGWRERVAVLPVRLEIDESWRLKRLIGERMAA